ncbi:hypothetical protein ACFPM3_04625 [Streptomyces coeruleoprunus]|uniref:Uncharacterized protein n=1 Tax=Streptomyces coeruleoprunus TaxID=285563 RepID=A0ABV9X851_9ACTN
MSALRGAREETVDHIGVRPLAEVELALREVVTDSSRRRSDPFIEGASQALRWAMAREGSGPVTGARVYGVPGLEALTAEVDASAVQLDDPSCSDDAKAYTSGAHDALAWLCGHTDRQP